MSRRLWKALLLLLALGAAPLGAQQGPSVFAWGADDARQLRVPARTSATAIAAGAANTCILDASGQVRCWGCGNPATDGGQCLPWPGAEPCGDRECRRDETPAETLALGAWHGCVLDERGIMDCWGCGPGRHQFQCHVPFGLRIAPRRLRPPDAPAGPRMALGRQHSCLIADDGRVRCWQCGGRSDHGQCDVPEGLTALAIAAGGLATCAIARRDGRVICWGLDAHGQVPAPEGLVARALAMGERHACALGRDGSVTCWGCRDGERQGQCAVPEGLRARAIAASDNATCAIRRDDRQVVCWGCGGTATGVCAVPPGLTAEAIAMGAGHAVVLTRNPPEGDPLDPRVHRRRLAAAGPVAALSAGATRLAEGLERALATRRHRRDGASAGAWRHPFGPVFVPLPSGPHPIGSCSQRRWAEPRPLACLPGEAPDAAAARAELPQRLVTLPEGLAIQRDPVDRGLVARFRAATGGPAPPPGDGPATGLNWTEASDLAAWLTRASADGARYRLPAEAEWEAAARTGVIDPDAPDAVREWTADCWERDHRALRADGAARERPDCAARTLRGGSWADPPYMRRPAWREPADPRQPGPVTGFRLVRVPGAAPRD